MELTIRLYRLQITHWSEWQLNTCSLSGHTWRHDLLSGDPSHRIKQVRAIERHGQSEDDQFAEEALVI